MSGRYEFSLPARPSRDGWFKIGSLDVTTTALLVILAVSSWFWFAVDEASLYKLSFHGTLVRQGEVWRLATWPLVNPLNDRIIFIVIGLVFFWFVGHQVEELVGRKPFTLLIVLITVIPTLLVTFLDFAPGGYPVQSLNELSLAILVVFALDQPNRPFFFGVPAWVMAIIYIIIEALYLVNRRSYELLTVIGLSIVVAVVVVRQFGQLPDVAFIPQVSRKRGSSRRNRRSRRAKSKVVSGPWAGSPEPAHTAADQMELDGLLDKISAQGMDSLSRAEKARLNELSKKLRGR